MENSEINFREGIINGDQINLNSPIIQREFTSEQIVIALNPLTPPITSQELVPPRRSPLKSIASSTGPVCRICHEYENSEDLIAPCECSGSIAQVHKACLTTWLITSGRNYCEICGKSIIISPNPTIPQFLELEEESWFTSHSWITIILLFLFSISLSIFYCIHMTNTSFEFWTAVTLVSLNIVACASICFHAFYSPR